MVAEGVSSIFRSLLVNERREAKWYCQRIAVLKEGTSRMKWPKHVCRQGQGWMETLTHRQAKGKEQASRSLFLLVIVIIIIVTILIATFPSVVSSPWKANTEATFEGIPSCCPYSQENEKREKTALGFTVVKPPNTWGARGCTCLRPTYLPHPIYFISLHNAFYEA